jgi:glycosyltransferase involved in cell wall biosynthesis
VLHHVAFAIPQLARGGATLKNGGPDGVFLTLLTNLDRARYRATLIVGDASDGDLISQLPDDVQVVDLQTNTGRFRTRVARRYPVLRLARALNDLEPDAVLATLRMDLTLAATRSVAPETTAFISRVANNMSNERATLSTTTSRAKQRLQAWSYERVMTTSDLVIAQSRSMERDLADLFGSEVAAKTVALPNPIDLVALEKRAASGTPQPRAGFPQVVTVGRLEHQKGYDLLIQAFRRVRDVWPEAHLRIIGEGVQRAELEALRDSLDLTAAVELVGFSDNPFGYLGSADLYVCSSRYEGFSNALAEAVGTGLPAVAPAGPAAGDEIVNPEFGALIPRSEPNLLADAILTLVERLTSFDRAAISADLGERLSCREVVHRYEDTIDRAILLRRTHLQPSSRRAMAMRGVVSWTARSTVHRSAAPQTSSAPIMPRPDRLIP